MGRHLPNYAAMRDRDYTRTVPADFPEGMKELSNGPGLYDKSALHDAADGSKFLSFGTGILIIQKDGCWRWSPRS